MNRRRPKRQQQEGGVSLGVTKKSDFTFIYNLQNNKRTINYKHI